jgi:hypothetical protein
MNPARRVILRKKGSESLAPLLHRLSAKSNVQRCRQFSATVAAIVEIAPLYLQDNFEFWIVILHFSF